MRTAGSPAPSWFPLLGEEPVVVDQLNHVRADAVRTTGPRDRRATRTSGGRGGGSCWARKSGQFYGPGRRGMKSKQPPNACSTWSPDIKEVAERTVNGQ